MIYKLQWSSNFTSSYQALAHWVKGACSHRLVCKLCFHQLWVWINSSLDRFIWFTLTGHIWAITRCQVINLQPWQFPKNVSVCVLGPPLLGVSHVWKGQKFIPLDSGKKKILQPKMRDWAIIFKRVKSNSCEGRESTVYTKWFIVNLQWDQSSASPVVKGCQWIGNYI